MPVPKVSVLKRVDCQSTLSVKRESTVVGERENGRAQGRHASVSASHAPVFACARYFQAPATQAKITA